MAAQPRQSWRPLAVIALSMVMIYITSFGINVLIAPIVTDLQTSVANLQLVIVAASLIAGSLMYLIEGEEGGYMSIPVGGYWAVVTITTLGFGDITPETPLGQFLTSILALMGYAILAVPTGIVSAEIYRQEGSQTTVACPSCGVHGHLPDARFCRRCGAMTLQIFPRT